MSDGTLSLLPFQRRFLRQSEKYRTAALCLPRGNGKTRLAGHVCAREMRRIQALEEIVLVSGSIEQCRAIFRFARMELGESDFRYLDSSTRCSITRKSDNARLRVVGSNAKTTFGLVNTPLVILEECGAWEVTGGTLMHDAVATSMGKPDSDLRAIYISTLAPSLGGWWHDLVGAGTIAGRQYVQLLQADRDKWDQWREIMRVNPLARISEQFQEVLRDELNQAKHDTRLKSRFLSYRLNLPTRDEAEELISVTDFEAMIAREVQPRNGNPIIGLDPGANRAWSAAVAMFPNGRIECRAIAPGVPDLGAQEARDQVPPGTYTHLAELGILRVSDKRVPPMSMLVDWVLESWGQPFVMISDYARLNELRDTCPPCEVVSRRTLWIQADEDVRACRRLVMDGPANIDPVSAELLAASCAVAKVQNNDTGLVRMVKRGVNNQARDDVAAAWVLASGEFERQSRMPAGELEIEYVH